MENLSLVSSHKTFVKQGIWAEGASQTKNNDTELVNISKDDQSFIVATASFREHQFFTNNAESDHSNSIMDQIVGGCVDLFNSNVLIALSGGDLVLLDQQDPTFMDIIGGFPSGIEAFCPNPERETLAIVTKDGRIILMQKGSFSLIMETSLVKVVKSYQNSSVSAGWGKKETQFHGSQGKEAAVAKIQIKESLLSFDDRKSRISWRPDGQYFAISFLMNTDDEDEDEGSSSSSVEHRQIAIFDCNGILISTSEPTEGLGQAMSWRGDGSLIAATQYTANDTQMVIFYEKNGLRHGQFTLHDQKNKVKELIWNCDGSILAIIMSNGRVDLWTTCNYHWYLKYSIVDFHSSTVQWSHDNPMILCAGDEHGKTVARYEFKRVFYRSSCDLNDPFSLSVVVDGPKLQLTPFAIANIPPPMSLCTIDTGFVSNAVAIAIDSTNSCALIVCSGEDNEVSIYKLGPILEKTALTASLVSKFKVDFVIKQLVLLSSAHSISLYILSACNRLFHHLDGELRSIKEIPENLFNIQLCNTDSLYCQTDDNNTIFKFDKDADSWDLIGECPLSNDFNILKDGKILFVDQNRNFVVDNQIVHSDCTSYIFHPEFVCTTDSNGLLRFFPFSLLSTVPEAWIAVANRKERSEEFARLTEGGALCVAVVPKTAALVIQMPRGNLETVYPRAFVLSQTRKLLDSLKYREAFVACRRHRIDLNIIYDHNPILFKSTLNRFVTDLKDNEYLNLFLTSLKNENVALTRYGAFVKNENVTTTTTMTTDIMDDKVNFVCDQLRNEMIKIDKAKYADSIITSLVCRSPPDHGAALDLVTKLDPSVMEKTLKYLVFLVPAEQLYRVALGMYNLPLALSVAKHSSMDPAEYTVFLNEIHALESETIRKFKLDDYLQRYELALSHLLDCKETAEEGKNNPWTEETIIEYIKRHELYRFAFKILLDRQLLDLWKCLCRNYGKHFLLKDQLYAAVDMFIFANDAEKRETIDLAIRAGYWQVVVLHSKDDNNNSADHLKTKKDDVEAVCNVLCEQRRFKEAFDLAKDHLELDKVVNIIISGRLWMQAMILVTKYHSSNSLANAAINEATSACSEIESLATEFIEKAQRLELVQGQLVTELDPEKIKAALENNSGTDLADNMSTMSLKSTASLLSTTSTLSNISRATSSRSKRKADKQRMRGKPGSPFEREYLRDGIKDLIAKLANIITSNQDLLQFLSNQRLFKEASQLQTSLATLAQKMSRFAIRLQRLVQAQEEKMGPEILAALGITPWSIPTTLQIDHVWKTAFDIPSCFSMETKGEADTIKGETNPHLLLSLSYLL